MGKVHIEIVLERSQTDPDNELQFISASYLNSIGAKPGTCITNLSQEVVALGIRALIINESRSHAIGSIDFFKESVVEWHIYQLNSLGPQAESVSDSNGDNVNVANDYILPSTDLHTLWENLIYDHNVKEDLLDYSDAIMSFSQRGVNFNTISCNKVILLHGPPGTGKTSLCKALAQKLSIRMRATYPKAILIEINSHNLFSKWFSESGKMVTKMFDHIRDVCEMSNTLVCVLIDEVESLAHAREQCLSGNEPSDAFKVVNAVLTQIDNIKRYPNVLLLSTSNIMRAIDIAFVDRADFKMFIGPPNVCAIKKIYMSCIQELTRVNIICFDENKSESLESQQFDQDLTKISEISLKLSGRMLRKLPLLAWALCTNKCQKQIGLYDFMSSMSDSIQKELCERGKLLNGTSSDMIINGH